MTIATAAKKLRWFTAKKGKSAAVAFGLIEDWIEGQGPYRLGRRAG